MTRPGTLLLLYHRVAAPAADPHGLAVTPAHFAAHCEVLRRHPVVPLAEAGHDRREIAITFDDGYADNAAVAGPLLRDAGLPAIFFITTGLVGTRAEAWWDRLARIVLEQPGVPAHLDCEVAGRRLWIDMRSTAARARSHLAIFWRLRPLPPERIAAALDDLAARLGDPGAPRESHRWMSAAELRALAATPGIEIGGHTISHPLLASLDAAAQWREIDGGAAALQELAGRRPRFLSYPHGGPDAFDATSQRLARDAGFALACTAIGGLVHEDSDPFRLPRVVVGDWDGPTFARRLQHWLAAA